MGSQVPLGMPLETYAQVGETARAVGAVVVVVRVVLLHDDDDVVDRDIAGIHDDRRSGGGHRRRHASEVRGVQGRVRPAPGEHARERDGGEGDGQSRGPSLLGGASRRGSSAAGDHHEVDASEHAHLMTAPDQRCPTGSLGSRPGPGPSPPRPGPRRRAERNLEGPDPRGSASRTRANGSGAERSDEWRTEKWRENLAGPGGAMSRQIGGLTRADSSRLRHVTYNPSNLSGSVPP